MSTFSFLFKKRLTSKAKDQTAQNESERLLKQAYILEPILTPSGLPFELETETNEISVDEVDWAELEENISDFDFESDDSKDIALDNAEVHKVFVSEDLPYDFLDPQTVGFESGTFWVHETGEVTID
ncbi:hypothetical protein [Sphaerothrix gracilis]|uniref:hypothetical protein n=1 Tax=Sphaerothrix gracilis TaxID=3151835 RepID=UPI0031FBDD09